jgi:ankyrin repeat protein
METIIFNNHLATYLISFLDIPNTIHLMQTSNLYYRLVTLIPEYQILQKCKPNYTIDSICEHGNINVLKWFIIGHEMDFDKILIKGAKYGNLDIVYQAIDQGANIHAEDESALLWSSENGHLEVVRYLVDQGANIHARDDETLLWSASAGHLEVVHYLVDQGANIHALDDLALRWSAENGHLEVVQQLFLLCKNNCSTRRQYLPCKY